MNHIKLQRTRNDRKRKETRGDKDGTIVLPWCFGVKQGIKEQNYRPICVSSCFFSFSVAPNPLSLIFFGCCVILCVSLLAVRPRLGVSSCRPLPGRCTSSLTLCRFHVSHIYTNVSITCTSDIMSPSTPSLVFFSNTFCTRLLESHAHVHP